MTDVNDKMECLNCRKQVDPGKAKLFAEVFVCSECYALAESMYTRMQREMRQLLVLSREAIREALVQGRFHPTQQDKEGISKAELLREIIKLSEVKDAVRRGSSA